MIEIVLFGQPMAKERVRVTRSGHAYTPKRTVTYEGRLSLAAQQAMKGRKLFTGALEVDMKVFMTVPASRPIRFKKAALDNIERPTKRPDFDNFAKMLDALNLIVWSDDAQIVDGRIRKFYSDQPRMEITVQPVCCEGWELWQ